MFPENKKMDSMASNKKVITVGVFDFFHIGHLNLLVSAKCLGDTLIVAVHDDIFKSKGIEFLYSLEDRIRIISSLRCVDTVIPYERVDLLIERIDFDIFAHGPDQNHQYFQKAFNWCHNHCKSVIELPRTEGISSTIIREILKKKNV